MEEQAIIWAPVCSLRWAGQDKGLPSYYKPHQKDCTFSPPPCVFLILSSRCVGSPWAGGPQQPEQRFEGPGEAWRRESARDEQEASEYAGGAAYQKHALAEGLWLGPREDPPPEHAHLIKILR